MSHLARLLVHLTGLGATVRFEPLEDDAVLATVELVTGKPTRGRIASRIVTADRARLAASLVDVLLLELEAATAELGLPVLDRQRVEVAPDERGCAATRAPII